MLLTHKKGENIVSTKVWDINATFRQFSHRGLTGNCDHDIYAIYLRHSHDSRETFVLVSHASRTSVTFVRVSHDVHVNVARFYFLVIKSRNVLIQYEKYMA